MGNQTSNRYPFATKKQIAARFANGDTEYVISCLVALYERQTSHEQETASTLSRNHVGFMSSHATHGTRIAKLVLAGETLSDEDVALVWKIVPRYTRQIAAAARAEALEANPELAEQGKVFGVC